MLVLHTGYAGNSKMGFTSYHAEGALRQGTFAKLDVT